ncbi:helix-turn-helix domain-containing protein [Acinetobacter sp. TUM15509]|uniref:helix-turn-helix domain-containing protein n=1 Tax=Acinetobacter sp. TUM15509 TaxID=2609154 RepID=UPI00125D6B1E|nr:helix-turn-helix transcriptional regulator [Acinetobacter sp. TUM15509]
MNDDAKSKFCNRLKAIRKTQKISQEKLGLLIGLDEFVASTRINRYEKGIHTVDPNTAERIAKALDEPLSFFYAETEELAELNRIFYHLDTAQKQQLLAVARELTSTAED